MPRDDLDLLAEEFRLWNSQQGEPLRECPTCHHPTLDDDWDQLFEGFCSVCGSRALDFLMAKIVKRLGPLETVGALMRLAGEKD